MVCGFVYNRIEMCNILLHVELIEYDVSSVSIYFVGKERL